MFRCGSVFSGNPSISEDDDEPEDVDEAEDVNDDETEDVHEAEDEDKDETEEEVDGDRLSSVIVSSSKCSNRRYIEISWPYSQSRLMIVSFFNDCSCAISRRLPGFGRMDRVPEFLCGFVGAEIV